MTLGSEQGVIDKTKNTDTDLIGRALDSARGVVDDELEAAGLVAPSTSVTLSLAVDFIASSLVGCQPGATDPTTDYKVDGFERSDGNDESQAEGWENAGMRRIAAYIEAKTYEAPTTDAVALPRSTTS